MAADATDRTTSTPLTLGQLQDVDATTAAATGVATLVKGVAAGAEWAAVPASAAIPNAAAAPTQTEFNAVLAALRAHGVILP